MWKYIFLILICLITLEVWKCGNMSSLSLSSNPGSLEVWTGGNMSSLSSSSNSGSVEIWKSGNVSWLFNLIPLEVWKSGNVSGMIWELKIGLARAEMTCVTSDCCMSIARQSDC